MVPAAFLFPPSTKHAAWKEEKAARLKAALSDRTTLTSSLSFDLLLFPPFFSLSTLSLSSKKIKNHSLELVPRAAVLSAHARERALGLGDGDIEAYKAFIVECAFFFSFVFFLSSSFVRPSFFSALICSLFLTTFPPFSLSFFLSLPPATTTTTTTTDMSEVARHSSGALRQRVVASAAVFARRHLFRRGLAALPPLPLALACLFLAAKVEESHVSARYLLRSAERAAAEGCFSPKSRERAAAEDEEAKKGGGGGLGGGGSNCNNASISLVASSSSSSAAAAAFQRDHHRNSHASAPAAPLPSPLKKPAAAAAAAAAAPLSSNPPPPPPPPLLLLPLPTPRQLLEAEAELVSSLGAGGLLLWSPYPDALEAAAAIEGERERMKMREIAEKKSSTTTTKSSSSSRRQQLPLPQPLPLPPRLGARAWAAVSVSIARTDACLWAPPHVVGFAAAAVAAAAADREEEAERLAEDEEEEEEEVAGGEEAARERRASGASPSSSSSSCFTAEATRWFSSLDVDLDPIAEVAAELCYAAGVERAEGKGDARKRRRTGSDGGGNDGGGGSASAHQRADAALRVFEFLRSR